MTGHVASNGTVAFENATNPGLFQIRKAQLAWASTPLRERLAILRRFRHLLADHAEYLADILQVTAGRPPTETLTAEVLPLADACRFLEKKASQFLRPRYLGRSGRPLWLQGVKAEVRREPLGVVLVIGPSNYPLFLPGVQAVQALAAGNAVLLKPGSGAGPVARRFAELLYAAGLDNRLLQVLSEEPESARHAMASGVDKVFLTGSAQTGVAVLKELADTLTPAVVELSGCDAAFIRPDADLDLVTRALAFAFRLKNGQTCIAPRRILVARELASELEKRLVAVAKEIAPLAVPPRSAMTGARLVSDAVRQGARLCAGHISTDANLIAPVVIADARPEMLLLQEELFGPVLALLPVRDDEDALAAASRCPYALGATIFGDEPGASALARRVRAGVVVINDVIVPTADPRLPFGGRGRSGFGVTRGAEGLLEMTALKAVCKRHGRWHPHLEPSRAGDGAMFLAYLRAVHGGRLRDKVAGWWALLRELVRWGGRPKAGEECGV
jgi:acyl-CoA reductase-like NAD-dependent aldehyde dehydrogenase